MKYLRFFALILALAAGSLYADDYRDRYYREDPDRAYREGYAQGQADRSRNTHDDYRTRDYRRGNGRYRDAYRNGYEAGYNQGGRGAWYRQGDRDRDWNRSGGRGGWENQAYIQGMRDGRLDGQHDRATGHSFRPTKGDNYKHADRGYSSSFGNKDMYKHAYRNGYVPGYEQGYRR